MASKQQLEQALRNAHRAGDKIAAATLAKELKRVSAGGDRSIIDTFQDYSDAAGTVLSNIGGTIAGSTYGFAKGLYNAVDEGTYGTQKGVDTVRQTMADVTDQFSKGDAYTPGGQAVLDSAAEAVAPVVDAISDFDRLSRLSLGIGQLNYFHCAFQLREPYFYFLSPVSVSINVFV